MRHRVAKKHLSRTPAHLKAMRRNMAQSLLQYGQIETTIAKAKEVRPFVEKLISTARKGTIQSRQRVAALLGDRSMLDRDEEEQYEEMTDAQRQKVMVGRSGRRHRSGQVPAGYNKKKIPFVARSVIHKLMTEVAPRYKDRPGGYTRIIRLAKRRIGDNSDLAIIQLVDPDEAAPEDSGSKKQVGVRRQRVLDRIAYVEGKKSRKSRQSQPKKSTAAAPESEAPEEAVTDQAPAAEAEASSPEASKEE